MNYDAYLARETNRYLDAGCGPSGDTEAYIERDLGGPELAELTVMCSVSDGVAVDSAVAVEAEENGVRVALPQWDVELTPEESDAIARDYWQRMDEDAADMRAEMCERRGGEW